MGEVCCHIQMGEVCHIQMSEVGSLHLDAKVCNK